MPFYQYRAMDQTGRTNRGWLAALNEVDLELRLKRMGLDLITLRQTSRETLPGGERITRPDLITFCFHLEQITRAGIPLLDGLRDLRDTMEKRSFRDILSALLEDLEGGKVLSQSLAAHPSVFDNVFVSVVRAGEQTGRLDVVFANLASTLKWQDEAASQTKRLMIYPAFVMAFVLLAVGVLMGFMVPRFEPFLKTANIQPPTSTLAMFATAHWLRDNGLWLLLGITAASTALAFWVRKTVSGQLWRDRMLLKLPVLGAVLKKVMLARFAHYLSLMYRSGVTVLEALRTSEAIVGNRVVANGIRQASQQISEGRGLTDSFDHLGLFPPLVIRMLRVGENTGALDSALDNVTYFYNREVADSIEHGLKLLGPALILFVAILLGFFMVTVLLPVYDMAFNLPL
ncbi:MAG: type II secretion system F family protein [Hydrogenophilaceae bacterium]|nr:type II secretion system F family protein [Hydrogenophilaceae bacterium]